MATYEQLRRMNSDNVFDKNLMDFETSRHKLPNENRTASDAFYESNKLLPGVMFTEGYTEPEEYRDIMANNRALSRIDEVKPILERFNEHLTAEQLEDQNYSYRVLRFADSVLTAKDAGLSDDVIDYMCDEAFPRDYESRYFGSAWRDYHTNNVVYLADRKGYNLDVIKVFEGSIRENESALETYLDLFENPNDIADSDGLKAIAQAPNFYASSEIEDALRNRDISEKGALEISKSLKVLVDAESNPDVNRWVTSTIDEKAIGSSHRLSSVYHGGYVRDCVALFNEVPELQKRPELFTTLANDYVYNDKNINESDKGRNAADDSVRTAVSMYDFYLGDKENDIALMAKCCGGDGRYIMFYDDPSDSHGASIKDLQPFADRRGLHLEWGSESDGLNGGTYVLYSDDKSTMHPMIKEFADKCDARRERIAQAEAQNKDLDKPVYINGYSKKNLITQNGHNAVRFPVTSDVSPNNWAVADIKDNNIKFAKNNDDSKCNIVLTKAEIEISAGGETKSITPKELKESYYARSKETTNKPSYMKGDVAKFMKDSQAAEDLYNDAEISRAQEERKFGPSDEFC